MTCYFESSYYTSYFDICEEVVVPPDTGGGGGGWPVPRPLPPLVVWDEPIPPPPPLVLAYEVRIIERDENYDIVAFTITPFLH